MSGRWERGFLGGFLVGRVVPGGEDTVSVHLHWDECFVLSVEVTEHARCLERGLGNASKPRGFGAGFVAGGCRHDEVRAEVSRALEGRHPTLIPARVDSTEPNAVRNAGSRRIPEAEVRLVLPPIRVFTRAHRGSSIYQYECCLVCQCPAGRSRLGGGQGRHG